MRTANATDRRRFAGTPRRLARLCLAIAATALLSSAMASAAAAASALDVTTSIPDYVTAGKGITVFVSVQNVTEAPLNGNLTVRYTFPTGVAVADPLQIRGDFPTNPSCTQSGQVDECVTDTTGLPPGGELRFKTSAHVDPNAIGSLLGSIEVSGGGVPDEITVPWRMTVGPIGPFAVKAFDVGMKDGAKVPATQAGANPAELTTDTVFLSQATANLGLGSGNFLVTAPPESFKDVVVHVPPGFVGNPMATPIRCSQSQLTTPVLGTVIPQCPLESQIGVVQLNGGDIVPLYNVKPPAGSPAEFGFFYNSIVVALLARVRPSDGGIDIVTKDTPAAIPLPEFKVTMWGVSGDSSHDPLRGVCLQAGFGNDGSNCPLITPRVPFLRMPTSCTGEALKWGIEVNTYQHPESFIDAESSTPTVEGCERVPFNPSITVQPTTHRADSPTGLDVDLTMPQEALENPEGIAEADVKDTTVVQPAGTRINPATADGLTGCSEAQIGYEGNEFPMPAPIHLDGSEPSCPDSSKIGTVEIESPLIPDNLEGFIYQAKQGDNPFGSTLAFYAVASADGVMIKLPAEVKTDPQTGQVTTIFRDSPQLPFEHYRLHFFGGSRAPLITPPTCGTKTTESTLTGWANPGQPVHYADSFQITEGAQGGACPATEAARPFAPSFEAGTTYPAAGEFSSFVMKVGREDGMQEISTIATTLPEGLLAKLKDVPYCPQAAIEAAQGARAAAEQGAPSCPAASQVGIADAGAGAGPTPFHQPGRVYLAGPYKGAPLSLVIVTPALAGPLDLGTVVVRTALRFDPETAQVHVVSDPIPSFLTEGGDGFPLDVRQIAVQINREGFTLNPTSCEPMAVAGRIGALQGATADVSSRFQARGCGRLAFKPKLHLRLGGQTRRAGHPSLRAAVTMPTSGQANIARASVSLPHSEFLAQGHLADVCTRVQYAEGGGGGAGCPKRSVYGHAVAYSPLLDRPLEGKVYLRSNGGERELPDLVASLDGQIHIDLVGYVGSDKRTDGLRTSFATVPDAPVSRFVLTMPSGKHSLLENSTNICRGAHRAIVRMQAHNGKVADSKAKVSVAGCPKRRGRGR